MKAKLLKSLAKTAVVAALYAVLTMALAPIAYGPLQFRVSEAMTLLPLLMPEAAVGLTIGCLIANTLGGWYDMVFGTLATLIASVCTYFIGRNKKLTVRFPRLTPILGGMPPILINAVVLPLMWYFFAGDVGYWVNFGMILGTQAAVIYIVGLPLYFGLKSTKVLDKLK